MCENFIVLLIYFLSVTKTVIPAVSNVVNCTDDETKSDTVQRIENITKSWRDERLYRCLKLRNRLQVLLISDTRTEKSAASMVINVGSINDPKEYPGMAHLLEHVILHSSVNDFKKYVLDRAGYTNAVTREDTQAYMFEIDSAFLSSALDRFVNLLKQPLIDSAIVRREIKAVNQEYEQIVDDTQVRLCQLEKMLSKADHPFKNFAWGNKMTLQEWPERDGVSIVEKLSEFHKIWFSSNIMYLAVLGKETLDEMEEMILFRFENLEDKNVRNMLYLERPWQSEQLQRVLYVVPVKDELFLRLTFPVPDVRHQYRTAPENYLCHLIQSRGEGSLITVLQKNSLALSIRASYEDQAGFGFLKVEIYLTQTAKYRVADILVLFFHYIHLVKTKGIQKWIFEERKEFNERGFSFKEDEPAFLYVQSLALSMAKAYPVEDTLVHNYICDRWEPSFIENFLKYITPENLNFFIVAKVFEKEANERELWFGTKYEIETIPEELMKEWRELTPSLLSESLQLPKPIGNEFVMDNFELYSISDANEPKELYPRIIRESSLSRIWFKQDNHFKVPKLDIRIDLLSPMVCKDPSDITLLEMFSNLVLGSFKEFADASKLAGFEWAVTVINKCGLQVYMFGYSEIVPMLLKKLLSEMINIDSTKINKNFFENLKIAQIRSLKNFDTELPYHQANWYASSLLEGSGWDEKEHISLLKRLRLDDMKKMIRRLFSSIFIHGLIHGNCDIQTATELVGIIENPFKRSAKVLPQQLLTSRQVLMDYGSNFVYKNSNKYHVGSAYYVFFQIDTDTKSDIVIDLFWHMIQDLCFSTLRGQFGYLTFCNILRNRELSGFVIAVQSEEHPMWMDIKVEEFLQTLNEELIAMTDEEFQNFKSISATSFTKPKQLQAQSMQYWIEISTGFHNFDRLDKKREDLRQLEKKDVLEFFGDVLHPSSVKRRKLASHVVSKVTNPSIPRMYSFRSTEVEDTVTFRSSSTLSSLPPPFARM